jgi:hypothetical protein|tara:strand:+ start:1049 stop:1264 length:216 start_codon:yes stop_codon:yes gene_type:complete
MDDLTIQTSVAIQSNQINDLRSFREEQKKLNKEFDDKINAMSRDLVKISSVIGLFGTLAGTAIGYLIKGIG